MNFLSNDTKLTIQIFIAVALILTGVIMLFLGFYTEPPGQIHESVLIAYGEVSTFAGSLLGLDYHYKYKMFVDKGKYEDKYEEKYEEKDTE